MVLDKETTIALINLHGVAACAGSLDKSGALRVYLLHDTPKVREIALQIIGDQLPTEQVIFEPQRPEIRCSFCDKHRNEVRSLIQSPITVIQGKELGFSIYICDECVVYSVKIFREQGCFQH